MKRLALFVPIILAVNAGLALAQTTVAGFETQGSITAGYRFTDVSGREQMFSELFNLRDGLRLNDFTISGKSVNKNRYADSYTLTASGLGGDPFVGTQLTVNKNHLYNLRVNYRQSYYYWNRNDAAAQPTGLLGLTSNHDFATVRRIGSIDLNAYVTPNLRLTFDYSHGERRGNAMTTRTLDYFGAPSTWGGFMRANPYLVEMPLDENSNRTMGGVAYSRRDWNFFYKAGYQAYNERLNMSNPISPERSININDAATANELVTLALWNETRQAHGPISEFSYNGAVAPRISLRGGYIYYRYSGPGTVAAAFTGSARTTNAATIVPYNVSMTNASDTHEPNHVIDQGFTVDVSEHILFHADYRYARMSMENSVDLASTDAAGAHVGEETTAWREGLQTLDLAVEYAPNKKMQFRPGIRMTKRDIHVDHDGVIDSVASRPSKLVSPLLTVYYHPTEKLTFRGDIRHTTNGGPYTRISPRTDLKTRWIARYRLLSMLNLENNFTLRSAEYSTTGFVSRSRSNATTLSYSLNDKYSLFGGFTYDSFLAKSDITFSRGVAPLQATWRDQTVNRIWEAGVNAHPVDKVEIHLSGNYLRTTGLGEISGELPISGPMRWPLVTGTVSWDVPKAGKLSLDLQRTYYIEEIVPGDNFAANILSIRWTRGF